jgi:hypothetical protein
MVQADNGEYIFVDNPLLGLPLASILYLLQEKLDYEIKPDAADFVIEDFLTAFNFTEPEIVVLKREILRLSNNPGSATSSLPASSAAAPASPSSLSASPAAAPASASSLAGAPAAAPASASSLAASPAAADAPPSSPSSPSSAAASPTTTSVNTETEEMPSYSFFIRPIEDIDIEQFYTMLAEYGAVIPGVTIYDEEVGEEEAPVEVGGAAAAVSAAEAAVSAAEAVEMGGEFHEEFDKEAAARAAASQVGTLSVQGDSQSQRLLMGSPPRKSGKSGMPPNIGTPPPSARGQSARLLLEGAGGMGEEAEPGKPKAPRPQLELKSTEPRGGSSEQPMEGSARRQKGGSRYKKTFKRGKSRKRTTYRNRP